MNSVSLNLVTRLYKEKMGCDFVDFNGEAAVANDE